MKQQKLGGMLLSLALCQCLSTSSVQAAASNQAIEAAIAAAKIMAEGYKVSAANYPASHEVIVSTYANGKSKDVLTDCKIDALLIAKRVLEIEPQTVRVKVRFFAPTQESYRQVVITKPELAAFSTGSVTKDELLLSLEVATVLTGLHPAANGTAGRSASRSTPTTAVGPTSNSTSTGEFATYNMRGLQFSSSKNWKAKNMNNEYGDFLELWKDRTAWHSIIFRLQDRESPAAVVDEDNRLFFSLHSHRITGQTEMRIGKQNNIPALVLHIKDDENPKEPDRFETHVYFGNPHRVYSLSVRYCGADRATVDNDLNLILGSIVE